MHAAAVPPHDREGECGPSERSRARARRRWINLHTDRTPEPSPDDEIEALLLELDRRVQGWI
ncbi:hypothetical protein CUD01_18420 [Cellulomonas uda]|uniref:Uncharacterized protein n=1 Tax=Cellulomonas uda TaxID=1714 RepID=A0A4Y3KEG1_CELUD|nr:hypothetical protein CUD01_18420 [Cellulomonas uda]